LNFERFIAKRLATAKRESFSKPVIKISVISVALGLAVMIASVSIVVGFKNSIKEKVTGFTAHLQIIPFDNNKSLEEHPIDVNRKFVKQLKDFPNVKHVQFSAVKGGVLKTDDQIQGIVLKGVDSHYDWDFLRSNLSEGKIPVLHDNKPDYEVLISKMLADKLLLKTGDKIRVWFVNNNDVNARGRKFTVSGIYSTGMEEFDNSFIIGDLDVVSRLNGWEPGSAGAVEIILKDPGLMNETEDIIYRKIPFDLNIVSARELYPQIYNWLDLLDMNVVVILILLIMVAGINMVSTLLILIIERTSMVGLLKALGANNKSIGRIFLYRSVYIVMKGMLWGNVIGLAFYFIQKHFRPFHLDPQSYYVDYVPVELNITSFLLLNTGVLLLSLLIMYLPTWYINRVSPSKALRYE
jgi:lipoprotein-releasing system permease protein